jgi:hypothetical protein
VKSWQEPGASVSISGEYKVLVIAMVKDETSRRVIEDQLVKRLKGKGIASYGIISPETLKVANEELLIAKLTEGKFTHVLMMRLGDVEKELTYTQGSATGFYGGYGRYYGYGARYYSNPGYYSTSKSYFVETAVYSVNPNKLIWTGTTKTVDPTKMEETVTAIADLVSDKMKKDGFLK